jgi:conjugative transfer signal peptidase TraF
MTRRVRSYRLANYVTVPAYLLVAGMFAACALVTTEPSPRRAMVVWNASASAPIGFYRVIHGDPVVRGALVLVVPNAQIASFAAARGYLPAGIPLIKRIAAVAGDQVCAVSDDIFINGISVATRLSADRKGRPLPSWAGCRTLGKGDVFLLMAHVPGSFDGRYFGVTKLSDIAGRLVAIWTR